MNLLPLIEAKRDGAVLSREQITGIILDFTRGDVPDYQMAALLMAIYFRGLNADETRALTFAMRDSGEVLSLAKDPVRPVVDKHSTGGIGDKVSLPLAPLLACLGFRVPMISGRGLGITGGTLDKLESIPGFQTRLPAAAMVEQVEDIGCAICGQTETMCPADRMIYALRDATGTVPSVPLITASILSKKLSEGIEALVLDVKFGSAAFMKTREQARALANAMTQIASEAGVRTRALLTDMHSALGRAVGNWLEVKEAVGCLDERGPDDLRELVVDSAAHLLVLTGKSGEIASARDQVRQVLVSGAPRRKWDEMLQAQGASLDEFNAKLALEHTAPAVLELKCECAGFIARADALVIGEVVRDLGLGRMTKEARVDFDVGVDELAAVGDFVEAGSPLLRVHARRPEQAQAALPRLRAAFEIAPVASPRPARIVEVF